MRGEECGLVAVGLEEAYFLSWQIIASNWKQSYQRARAQSLRKYASLGSMLLPWLSPLDFVPTQSHHMMRSGTLG